MSWLTIQGVAKHYAGTVALDGIDLAIEPGSRTAIVGPSGSGKTTLLRIIGGFEQPDAGRITLDGQALVDGAATVPAHRRGIGFVPQDGALFPHLSVAANIGFGLARDRADRETRIGALMEMVELEARLAGQRPHELSGGQQQRVALARALAREPRLMLLDEPFSALDTGLRDATRRAVGRVLAEAGITAILVTHDQTEAMSFADQIAVLRDGRLSQVGAPRDLYLRPKDRETAAFLGDAILLPADLGPGRASCVLGEIAADTGARRGPAEIMLRPEQIALADAATPSCRAQVVHVEFGGADCRVDIRPLGRPDDPPAPLLTVRALSFDAPAIGSELSITVRGQAHIFPA